MNLKEKRNKLNMTQKEIAEKLNITTQAYANYEQELREPNITTLKKISKIFNCSIDYLVNNDFEEKKFNSNELNLKDYLNEKQIELVNIVKDLNNDDITRIIGYAEALKQKETSTEQKLNKLLKEYKGE